jgi:hypothetical protein
MIMGHVIETPVMRCTAIEHVQSNKPCTWVSVGDVNQATDITLDGHDLREIGLALAERAARLALDHRQDRLDRVRRVAEQLGVNDLDYLIVP